MLPSTSEWILILIVIVLVFGATKLPQLGDGLGRAIKNFKRAISGANEIEVTPKKTEGDSAGGAKKPESAKAGEKAG
jgi:sec-independent protein translocase protein TatA